MNQSIKTTSAGLILAAIYLIESSILGSALSHYTETPRTVFVFVFLLIIQLISGFSLRRKLNPAELSCLLIYFLILFTEMAFSYSQGVLALKALLLLIFLASISDFHGVVTVAAGVLIRLFNVVLIASFLTLILPNEILFEPSYLSELRRYDTGDGGRALYSSFNFTGLFLTGDNKVFLGDQLSFSRYSSYFAEPAIYVVAYLSFYAIISISRTPSILDRAFLFANIFASFSMTGILLFVAIIILKFLKGNYAALIKALAFAGVMLSLSALTFVNALHSLGFGMLSAKFSGSANLSFNNWHYIFYSTKLNGKSSFNARTGDFLIFDINLISLFCHLTGFIALTLTLFYWASRYLQTSNNRAALGCLTLLVTTALFTVKAPNHVLLSWTTIISMFLVTHLINQAVD